MDLDRRTRPDDYLHKVFEPTARAIDSLEKALAAVGCSMTHSRSTYADRRITSTGFGAPPFAPPT